jgi:hypothetical protein
MAKAAIPVTIRAGQSLSDAANIGANSLALIMAPMNFVDANLSFQVSADGVTFYDLIDQSGNEVQRAIDRGTAIPILTTLTMAITWLKIRSGPIADPVPQSEDVTLTLIVV